jgi:hypothetical protein
MYRACKYMCICSSPLPLLGLLAGRGVSFIYELMLVIYELMLVMP